MGKEGRMYGREPVSAVLLEGGGRRQWNRKVFFLLEERRYEGK